MTAPRKRKPRKVRKPKGNFAPGYMYYAEQALQPTRRKPPQERTSERVAKIAGRYLNMTGEELQSSFNRYWSRLHGGRLRPWFNRIAADIRSLAASALTQREK